MQFCTGLKCAGIDSTWHESYRDASLQPRMIARIHAGNTSNAYLDFERKSEWRRVPEWDAYARSIMEAA